jgi:hypothetical protein
MRIARIVKVMIAKIDGGRMASASPMVRAMLLNRPASTLFLNFGNFGNSPILAIA